jgi:hypothetical protein
MVMKITGKTLMVDFETEVKLGNNDAIELTLVHQAFISKKDNGTLVIDIELMEVQDVKFMGMELEPGFRKFEELKDQLSKFGINVNQLIREKCVEIEGEETRIKLTMLFRDKL